MESGTDLLRSLKANHLEEIIRDIKLEESDLLVKFVIVPPFTNVPGKV